MAGAKLERNVSPITCCCCLLLWAVPWKKFLVFDSGDVSKHAWAKHFAFPPNLQPHESEIVDAVFQSEKSIRGEPVESCKLRYFNSFEFF